MTQPFFTLALGAALAFGASAASSATLSEVTIGASLFSADGLDVIADDTSIETADFFGDVFVSAPIDGGGVDASAAFSTDLSIFDATFTEILGGTALDIGVADDTISILYDLAINEESSDPFAVAVLSFGFTLPDNVLSVLGDVDGEFVDLEVFGATPSSPVTVIPLPAGATLLLGALGALAIARRRAA
ncbi:MAG: VPLPA-CTERM sorting domain-containing protein [Pseudomonadota bacterium]